MPSGHITRVISPLDDALAVDLTWLPGDSSAIWIEIPPNNSRLSRLVYWNGNGMDVLVAAGAKGFHVGRVDSHDVVLAGIIIPDTSDWGVRGLCYSFLPDRCRRLDLPTGDMPGLARWDRESDTVYFALCINPSTEPSRFFATFDGEIEAIDGPLPIGAELPIGRPPRDTLSDCYAHIVPSVGDEPDTNGLQSQKVIPGRDASYFIDDRMIVIQSGGESYAVDLTYYTPVQISWSRDGEKALVFGTGHSNAVFLLLLVW